MRSRPITASRWRFSTCQGWLLFRGPAVFMTAALAASAAFAFVLGVILLPLTLIGLVAVIGILGLAPFVTAFVYWRNTLRAYALAKRQRHALRGWIVNSMAFAVILAVPVFMPAIVDAQVMRVAERALAADDVASSGAVETLRLFRWLIDTEIFVLKYRRETDPDRQRRLAELYRALTGKDIDYAFTRLDLIET
jgi:uncharacterized membrane protein